ncbi:MAG: Transcriptional regulator, Crp/Fnr family [Pseudolabrys sp.]|jgi:CRP/FNR family nitrogen fixation transcriptional regulator|nr:Transcriptional regulator, Crp/Fnr family [Pseudolabrys sp.]
MLAQVQVLHRVSELPARNSARSNDSLSAMFDMTGATMMFRRDEEIYGEGENAEYLYRVKSGCVRTYKILADGRRQIGAFYLPGDIFGVDDVKTHQFSAEAVHPTAVALIKRSIIETRVLRDTTLARQMLNLTMSELHRAQSHILLLIKSARERVASFLLEMASRKHDDSEVELPMSRQDIADYLGLTIETVSRTLTQLENASTIALPTSRRIILRNQAALARLD